MPEKCEIKITVSSVLLNVNVTQEECGDIFYLPGWGGCYFSTAWISLIKQMHYCRICVKEAHIKFNIC